MSYAYGPLVLGCGIVPFFFFLLGRGRPGNEGFGAWLMLVQIKPNSLTIPLNHLSLLFSVPPYTMSI